MNTVKSYTWPALLALVSGVTAFADIMQDTFVAQLLAYSLLALGIAAVVFFKAPWISGLARRAMPTLAQDFSPAAFAISCAVLGVAVYGFSQLSSRLSDQGGVIAAAYPEIESLQAQLGVVDAKVTQVAAVVEETAVDVKAIADETAFLTAAAGKWIGFERLDIYGEDGAFNFDAIFSNPSSFVFDSVDITVRDADNPSTIYIQETDQLIAPADSRLWRPEMTERPERMLVCISGQRRTDGVWTREERVYGNPNHISWAFMYRVVETNGLQVVGPQDRCA